ncbi:MAG: C45 family autoproteolytic acyltransferase/hydrolase [Planctomycetota bacterium]|nr:C45 family autoproteolytic acyltransferase/hydrolase [Planctomycetota bacterium]
MLSTLRFRSALLSLCWCLVFQLGDATVATAQTVARCGQGWLEIIDGYPVLHLKGTPYEMGYQQGALLRDRVQSNMHNLLVKKGGEKLKVGMLKLKPRSIIESITTIQKPFVPAKYFEEMEGLAAGAGLKAEDVIVANFIPEMFHCSGFAIMNSATKDGTLYHGRVLDYAIDWGLQDHAVVVVLEPDGGVPFVNVTYAGFIGSVTGMNKEHVSVGEMGGGGLGHWAGVPMALLVREALETAHDLDEAIKVFRDNPRTCQYFYVVADGKTNRAVGMEASWNVFTLLKPGEAHPLLPTPVEDSVLLSAGDRYKELSRRAKQGHGKFDAESALHLMDCPVAMKSNLHNVLFEPKSTKFWVANASTDKQPAANQKYFAFQLSELLDRKPDMKSPEIKLTLPAVSAK